MGERVSTDAACRYILRDNSTGNWRLLPHDLKTALGAGVSRFKARLRHVHFFFLLISSVADNISPYVIIVGAVIIRFWTRSIIVLTVISGI
jgi:hypothetical protein